MDELDKTFIDIDELAKRIEKRIQELEASKKEEKTEEDVSSPTDLQGLILAIDKRIQELEDEMCSEQVLDLEHLTNLVNQKLDEIEEDDSNLEKTLYDLNEVSKIINNTVLELEKKKEKKRKKAMYCDLARKKEYDKKKKQCKKRKVSKN